MFIRKDFKSLVDSFVLDLSEDEINYAQSKLGVLYPLFLSTLSTKFLKKNIVPSVNENKGSSLNVVTPVKGKKKKKKNNKNLRNKIKRNLESNVEIQLKSLQAKVKNMKKEVLKKKRSRKISKKSPSRVKRMAKRAVKYTSPFSLALKDGYDFERRLGYFRVVTRNYGKLEIFDVDVPFIFPFTPVSDTLSFLNKFGSEQLYPIWEKRFNVEYSLLHRNECYKYRFRDFFESQLKKNFLDKK
jgi:hypothetical protein